MLKFKKLSTHQPTFLLSILIGMLVVSIGGHLVLFWILETFLSNDNTFEPVLNANLSIAISRPIAIVLWIYLVLRCIQTEQLILISILIGVMSTITVAGVNYLIFSNYGATIIIGDLISISALLIMWILLTQTHADLANSISLGYFGFLILDQIILQLPNFELSGVLDLVISLCFAGAIAIIFGFITKLMMKVFNVQY